MKESRVRPKLDFKTLQKAGYRCSVICALGQKVLVPTCLLCNAQRDITVTSIFLDDKKKRAVKYYLCTACATELFSFPKEDQESFAEKVIERKIDTIMALPHFKISDLLGWNTK